VDAAAEAAGKGSKPRQQASAALQQRRQVMRAGHEITVNKKVYTVVNLLGSGTSGEVYMVRLG
jgi:hypothetical protein